MNFLKPFCLMFGLAALIITAACWAGDTPQTQPEKADAQPKAKGMAKDYAPVGPKAPIDDAKSLVSLSFWPEGKIRAATFTFDDTKPSHLTRVYPLFKEYGYKCTFFINSARIGPHRPTKWADWKKVAQEGFEVGNHTSTHWFGSNKEDPASIVYEGYDAIEKNTGVAPISFAFPGGAESKKTREYFHKSKHLTFRRQGIKDDNGKYICPKYIYLDINNGSLNKEQAKPTVDKLLEAKLNWHKGKPIWMYSISHAVDEKLADGIRTMLDEISKHKDKIWVTTWGNAHRYEKERDTATMKIVEKTPKKVVFILDHAMDKTIYDYPLSVWVNPNGSAKKATAKQGGKTVPVTIIDGKMRLDVVPGKDSVMVEWE